MTRKYFPYSDGRRRLLLFSFWVSFNSVLSLSSLSFSSSIILRCSSLCLSMSSCCLFASSSFSRSTSRRRSLQRCSFSLALRSRKKIEQKLVFKTVTLGVFVMLIGIAKIPRVHILYAHVYVLHVHLQYLAFLSDSFVIRSTCSSPSRTSLLLSSIVRCRVDFSPSLSIDTCVFSSTY